jgi:tetratricopeptide (TPR) repeat protein
MRVSRADTFLKRCQLWKLIINSLNIFKMTPKQKERLQQKIKQIKSALAADKRFWHGYYHDGQGLRYAIPRLFIQLQDYSGAYRYFTWFNKNFPGDVCYPEFLFEWTLVLFYKGKTKEAEGKAWETFCSNVYVFDKFFGRAITPLDESDQTDHEANYIDNYFKYAATQPELANFAEWLNEFEQTEKFKRGSEDFIALQKRLDTTSDFEARGYLIKAKNQLESLFKVEKQQD